MRCAHISHFNCHRKTQRPNDDDNNNARRILFAVTPATESAAFSETANFSRLSVSRKRPATQYSVLRALVANCHHVN